MLALFARERGRIVSRRTLLAEVWGMRHVERIETRTVDMHIAKLRKKIARDGDAIDRDGARRGLPLRRMSRCAASASCSWLSRWCCSCRSALLVRRALRSARAWSTARQSPGRGRARLRRDGARALRACSARGGARLRPRYDDTAQGRASTWPFVARLLPVDPTVCVSTRRLGAASTPTAALHAPLERRPGAAAQAHRRRRTAPAARSDRRARRSARRRVASADADQLPAPKLQGTTVAASGDSHRRCRRCPAPASSARVGVRRARSSEGRGEQRAERQPSAGRTRVRRHGAARSHGLRSSAAERDRRRTWLRRRSKRAPSRQALRGSRSIRWSGALVDARASAALPHRGARTRGRYRQGLLLDVEGSAHWLRGREPGNRRRAGDATVAFANDARAEPPDAPTSACHASATASPSRSGPDARLALRPLPGGGGADLRLRARRAAAGRRRPRPRGPVPHGVGDRRLRRAPQQLRRCRVARAEDAADGDPHVRRNAARRYGAVGARSGRSTTATSPSSRSASAA